MHIEVLQHDVYGPYQAQRYLRSFLKGNLLMGIVLKWRLQHGSLYSGSDYNTGPFMKFPPIWEQFPVICEASAGIALRARAQKPSNFCQLPHETSNAHTSCLRRYVGGFGSLV